MIVLAVAVATLAGAYGSQYIGGLAPCELCLYQRWPWWAAIALLLASFIPAVGPAGRGGLVTLAGIGLIAGTGIAFYHVGVEQHWWAGTEACAGPSGEAASVQELLAQIQATPLVRCDEVAWSLFGISMAGYNLLASLALAGFSLSMARRAGRAA